MRQERIIALGLPKAILSPLAKPGACAEYRPTYWSERVLWCQLHLRLEMAEGCGLLTRERCTSSSMMHAVQVSELG